MSKGASITLGIIVLILIGLAVWFVYNPPMNTPTGTTSSSTTTGTGTTTTTVTTAGGAAFDQTLSDGTITVPYPSADFGLAVNQAQLTVKSYIPPCDPSFNYCLFYNGSAYQGTNFESAGLRITRRTDLTTQNSCLSKEPTGYSNLTPSIASSTDYAASSFSPVGDAGAGHLANGSVYRLYYANTCYEFETRVGQTQFANYPSGTIQQFTSDDQNAIQTELQQILSGVVLPSSETVTFPVATPSNS